MPDVTITISITAGAAGSADADVTSLAVPSRKAHVPPQALADEVESFIPHPAEPEPEAETLGRDVLAPPEPDPDEEPVPAVPDAPSE